MTLAELTRTIAQAVQTAHDHNLRDLETYEVDGVLVVDVEDTDGHSYRITVEIADEN
jgi:hypothetical protein